MYDSVQLVQNSKALNGTQRVLLDDVISVDECAELTNLAHVRWLNLIFGIFGYIIRIPFSC